jgi:hypothetical protein
MHDEGLTLSIMEISVGLTCKDIITPLMFITLEACNIHIPDAIQL